jgi:DNA-binding transcriptional MerR regulator
MGRGAAPAPLRGGGSSQDPTGEEATLGDVAGLFSLTARAIRYYEQMGLIQPRRDESNRRIFGAGDRTRLQVIALLRAAHLPLKEINNVLQGLEGGEAKALTLDLLRLRREALQLELAGLRWVEEEVAALLER